MMKSNNSNSRCLSVLGVFLLLLCLGRVQGATIIVDANSGTQNQVNQAQPGDTILFSPGQHDDIDFHGFVASECDPTVLMSEDPANPAVLSSNIPGHPSLDVSECEWLIIENLVCTAGQTGIDIKQSHHVIMRENEITHTGNAGLKIRYRSTHVDFIHNVIHHTGRSQPQYGEGIYLGTAKAKGWEPWNPPAGGDANDTLSHIWIEGNEIYECGNGEAIDFKSDMIHVTVKGNHIHDIYPGVEDVQANAGAISIASGRDNPDQPGDFWVEENVIEDVYYGQGDPNSHQVAGTGIVTFGGGHYILNNTIGNCEQTAIDFSNAYLQYGLIPYFIYVHGNVINNNWGPDFTGQTGGLQNYIHYEYPGFSNPNSSQSWCGDIKSNCGQPELKEEESLCGNGNVLLSTGLVEDGVSTIEWLLDGVTQEGPSTELTELTVTEGGIWKVVLDSAGVCSSSAEVFVRDKVADFDLGQDHDLCESLTKTLTAGDEEAAYNYNWMKDGEALSASTRELIVEEEGTYEVTVSAQGCASNHDVIVVTSSLPVVVGDVLCQTGEAQLTALGADEFYWYDAASDGVMMHNGSVFEPVVSQSTTYFVQSGETSVKYTAGHTQFNSSVDGGDYASRKLKIVVEDDINVDSVTIYAKEAQTVHFRVLADDNATVLFDIANVVDAGIVQVPIAVTLAPGTYFVDAEGSTGTLKMENQNGGVALDYIGYGIDGLISFNAEPSWEANWTNGSGVDVARWRYFYDWKVSVGAACARVPVEAIVDPQHPDCIITSIEETSAVFEFYPNPVGDVVHFNHRLEFKIVSVQGKIKLAGKSDSVDVSELPRGIYFLILPSGEYSVIKE